MKIGFYMKLAWTGIKKNHKLYLPYIMTCIGMTAMYYIINNLQYSAFLDTLPGSATISAVLTWGSWVIAFFSVIFLFYTNSFLIRRRKKEFGLYNILGMGKKHLSLILVCETMIIMLFSFGAGLSLGILLSKSAELLMINIMEGEIVYRFSMEPASILASIFMTVIIYAGIFFLIFLNALRQIRTANPIALLHSENVGEKPPKANWLLGLSGLILLITAYWISVTIADPVASLMYFFIAVLLVILGTYLLFMAGSVLFCRILQKKKGYYYKSNHFVSVSSMMYRMKRNGAGLASICILATMVLVMMSSTTSLYFSEEEILTKRYPREINMAFIMKSPDDLTDEKISVLEQDIRTAAAPYQASFENVCSYRDIAFYGIFKDDVIMMDNTTEADYNYDTASDFYDFFFIPLSDYNRLTGKNETLSKDEVLVNVYRSDFVPQELNFQGKDGIKTYRVKKEISDFDLENGDAMMSILPTMTIIVPDFQESAAWIKTFNDSLNLRWDIYFDTGLSKEQQIALSHSLNETFRTPDAEETYGLWNARSESREANREDFFGLYGGLFYLGIMLSIVFIFAAILIIYYKQISEGYEDQSRFEIMQKVGMTKQEIRRSINSQLLTVFFLPLVFAGLHLIFAFPIIQKLLLLFNFDNVLLFAMTTAGCFFLFALFYSMVYKITSNAYYHIVSDAKE